MFLDTFGIKEWGKLTFFECLLWVPGNFNYNNHTVKKPLLSFYRWSSHFTDGETMIGRY